MHLIASNIEKHGLIPVFFLCNKVKKDIRWLFRAD